ncbi:hypothetical protein VB780_15170 [Leptolyngbya sp. CCNP1308]|nr:hypothetical protein [Leptolyngbya sp. CCNP1308]MEA5449919.1 hypothetical protein [Leptolyngbya sp. CCNP1308]
MPDPRAASPSSNPALRRAKRFLGNCRAVSSTAPGEGALSATR